LRRESVRVWVMLLLLDGVFVVERTARAKRAGRVFARDAPSCAPARLGAVGRLRFHVRFG